MKEDEKFEWSESLRVNLVGITVLVGILYGFGTLFMFGPVVSETTKSPRLIHILISTIPVLIFTYVVFESILVRQLAVPGAIFAAIYSFSNYVGNERYSMLYTCGLVVVTMIAIGFTEARATTGQFSDFWRSLVYHPLGWSKHFDIRTRGK